MLLTNTIMKFERRKLTPENYADTIRNPNNNEKHLTNVKRYVRDAVRHKIWHGILKPIAEDDNLTLACVSSSFRRHIYAEAVRDLGWDTANNNFSMPEITNIRIKASKSDTGEESYDLRFDHPQEVTIGSRTHSLWHFVDNSSAVIRALCGIEEREFPLYVNEANLIRVTCNGELLRIEWSPDTIYPDDDHSDSPNAMHETQGRAFMDLAIVPKNVIHDWNSGTGMFFGLGAEWKRKKIGMHQLVEACTRYTAQGGKIHWKGYGVSDEENQEYELKVTYHTGDFQGYYIRLTHPTYPTVKLACSIWARNHENEELFQQGRKLELDCLEECEDAVTSGDPVLCEHGVKLQAAYCSKPRGVTCWFGEIDDMAKFVELIPTNEELIIIHRERGYLSK